LRFLYLDLSTVLKDSTPETWELHLLSKFVEFADSLDLGLRHPFGGTRLSYLETLGARLRELDIHAMIFGDELQYLTSLDKTQLLKSVVSNREVKNIWFFLTGSGMALAWDALHEAPTAGHSMLSSHRTIRLPFSQAPHVLRFGLARVSRLLSVSGACMHLIPEVMSLTSPTLASAVSLLLLAVEKETTKVNLFLFRCGYNIEQLLIHSFRRYLWNTCKILCGLTSKGSRRSSEHQPARIAKQYGGC
jgi:hypothetical protein